jgi:aminoglycoside phosphotransferase
MSSAATARTEGVPVDADAGRREIFRLLTPRGGVSNCPRIVDVGFPSPLRVSRQIGEIDDDDLVVLRTRAPRTLQRMLTRRGLRAHLYALAPSVDHARAAAPLVQRAVRQRRRRLRDGLVSLSTRLHARELVGRTNQVVVLATRSLPPGQWLADLTDLADEAMTVAATLSWRGGAGGATALVLSGPDPARFVKVAFDEARAARLRHEHAALAATAAAVGEAIVVPSVRSLRESEGLTFLVEDAVDGRVAAGLPPLELEQLFERLAAWLVTWNERSTAAVDGAYEVLELARALDVDARYMRRLSDACARLAGPRPRVEVHGDLTMWNVLCTRTGAIGVVDWEEASSHGAPLSDLLYAAVDAELAHGGYEHRLQAFDAVFSARPTPIGWTCRRAAGRLALDTDTVRLAFHETWLRHAANQAVRGDGSDFQEIVHSRLAVYPERYPWEAGA